LQRATLGEHTVQLHRHLRHRSEGRAARGGSWGPPLWGVRLDSGDFLATLSRQVRGILDEGRA
jgi:nicotinic acid phosphoribosyltransferase